MTAWDQHLDLRSRRAAAERLTGVREQLVALNRELTTRLREARTAQEPGAAEQFTGEALNAVTKQYRSQLADQIRAHYEPRLEQLRASLTSDAQTVRSWADKRLPQLPNDAVGLMRAQIRWDQVRMRLEAGIPLRTILADADADTAVAIREWGPAWIEASAPADRGLPAALAGHTPPDHSGFRRMVEDRIAEVSGGEIREALTSVRTAEAVEVSVKPLLGHTVAVLAAGVDPEPARNLYDAINAAPEHPANAPADWTALAEALSEPTQQSAS